jgi:hypothetical protein
LVAGNVLVIGEPDAPAAGEDPGGQLVPGEGVSDAESLASGNRSQVEQQTDTSSDTEGNPEPISDLAADRDCPDARKGAGGGSKFPAGGGLGQIRSVEQNFRGNRPPEVSI